MFMAPINRSVHDLRVVRLLRRWVAERERGGSQLPSLVQLGEQLGVEAQAAVAIASMFELTEHCLGRALIPECCCSHDLSPDERAILMMLGAATSRPPLTRASIPHGLPGALLWAVESVRQLIGLNPVLAPAPARCPFMKSVRS